MSRCSSKVERHKTGLIETESAMDGQAFPRRHRKLERGTTYATAGTALKRELILTTSSVYFVLFVAVTTGCWRLVLTLLCPHDPRSGGPSLVTPTGSLLLSRLSILLLYREDRSRNRRAEERFKRRQEPHGWRSAKTGNASHIGRPDRAEVHRPVRQESHDTGEIS